MEGKQERNNPEIAKQQKLQAMRDLSSKFGGSAKIPEEELTAIGYVRRVQEDGTVRLLPYERMVELSQKDPDWEKPLKTRERPFERIAVELPTSERDFRHIPRTQKELLTDRLEGVEYAFFPNWNDGTSIVGKVEEIDPRIHNLRTFSLDFLEYLKQEGINGRTVPGRAAEALLFDALPMIRRNEEFDPDDPNDFQQDNFQKTHSEQDGSVTSMASKQMYDELTRLGGYFADVAELMRDFQARLSEPFSLTDKQVKSVEEEEQRLREFYGTIREIDRPYLERLRSTLELKEYLNSIGIRTRSDAIRYIFPKYLDHVGLSEMGAMIEKSAALHTLGESLSYMDTSSRLHDEEKELKQLVKDATPEERMNLSKRLKEIKEQKKKQKQLREGVIDYFSSPQVYADVCKRKVKEAQDFLIAGNSEEKGEALFYLDAMPNERLDEDPGRVSGDCTAGVPLPFDKGSVPLYNVKVFGQGGEQHVGNMYLLVTKTKPDPDAFEQRGEKKVWHFDAIQLPKSGISWDESLQGIIETLAKEAEEKGVDAITTNSQLHQISNYDYIANAVNVYWQEHGRQTTNVEIPKFNIEDRSELQGDGNAIVLWSKEQLSDPYPGELEGNQHLFNLQNQQGEW